MRLPTVRQGIAALVAPNLDEIAVLHRLVKPCGPGVMVDVGAHYGSSLRLFARDGWTVYAFEPDPANRAALERRVAHLENVHVDGRAITEQDGAVVDLFTSQVSSGISALSPFHDTHQTTARVETVRLDTALAAVDNVLVLKTDTEGYDLVVLRTFPWDRLHPVAVVAEFEDRKTIPLGYGFRDLANFLVERDYAVFVSEWFPVREYGVLHRWRSLRRYPTELADDRAWGNLVAVDPAAADQVLPGAGWLHRARDQFTRALARFRR